jgi:glycosyltransferase involved in cell wall biosynthesis
MSRRLVIHAPNVHQGGGRTLLLALLSSLPNDSRGEAIVDERLEIPFALPAGFANDRVRPTIRHRLAIERELPSRAGADCQLLCFHSLPPLRRCPAFVSVFVQNRNIISNTDVSAYPARDRFRIHLERAWFRFGLRTVDEFIVQTETMRDLLRGIVGDAASIRVLPFLPGATPGATGGSSASGRLAVACTGSKLPVARGGTDFDFCYVATGEPHKNHRRLIEAWCLLAQAGQHPSLCLTLDPARFPDLCHWIDEQVRLHGLNVINVGYVSQAECESVYGRSRALVYPSRFESFGLPLLEAQRHGLRIAAAEADYVRDVIEPDETLDPESPRSIARAVQRLLGLGNERVSILDHTEFVRQLFAA